jgi:type VI protein secretion system component VasF
MTHQEEHQQHHRKEREEKKEERKQHEHAEERRLGNIHPAWYLALGLVLTMTATLIWTFFFAGSF